MADILGPRFGGNMDGGPENTPKGDRAAWVYHPFLFAAFPILSLFSVNVATATPHDLVIPLVIGLAGVALLWLGLGRVIQQASALGMVISALVLLFFAYGPVVDGVVRVMKAAGVEGGVPPNVAYFVLVLLAAWGIYRLLRSQRSWEKVTAFLNTASLACVALAVVTAAYNMSTHQRPVAAEGTVPETTVPPSALPDIYYIVLDAYGRADVLRDYFDVNNEPFVQFLRDEGFYVADKSSSNYHWTVVALSSTLNMGYHEHPNPIAIRAPLGEAIRNSAVFRFLEAHGYTLVSFASGFSATELRDADWYLKPPFAITEFDDVLISATALRPLRRHFGKQLLHGLQTSRILYTLDKLETMEEPESPFFVFAHVLTPHGPWVFTDVGYPSLTDEHKQTEAFREFVYEDAPRGYREEVTALNARLKTVIRRIRERSPDAVIILQGDHGPRGLIGGNPEEWEDYVRKYSGILNAFYFPARNEADFLYPSISPVNTFRVLFNSYFGTDFEMLEDARFLRPMDLPINDWYNGEYVYEDRVY